MAEKYPIGIETFSEIIEGGFVYADKSEIIYKLLTAGKYFFLSRPRRFGKSLMLSTIEAYFEGRRDLFKGLWLDRDDVDWTARPVLRFNFVMAGSDLQDLQSVIKTHLSTWEEQYGVDAEDLSYGQRFFRIIEKAHQISGQKVAVLVDEYDKVLVNTMHDADLHEQMKSILKPLFSVLKAADRHIHFGILTGVSRFSKLSIFSDLNNLKDISLDSRYSTICGITEDEIRRYLHVGVAKFADVLEIGFDDMMRVLKENYDGYHFAAKSPDIYNPFSLINALDSREITHSWFESGTPSFLVEQIKNADEDLREVLAPLSTGDSMANSSAFDTGLTNLLYQTGYLTIKGFDREYDVYTLGIPNREVEKGLYQYLLPLYSGRDRSTNDTMLIKLRTCVLNREVDKFMEMLRSFLAGVPYDLSEDKHEIYFENNLFLIFKLLGLKVHTEYRTAQGRIDVVIETPKYIYVMELKLNGSAEDALRQISEKNYTLPFDIDGREVIRVGVNISKTTRTVERWIVG